jgi:hypothetical protein
VRIASKIGRLGVSTIYLIKTWILLIRRILLLNPLISWIRMSPKLRRGDEEVKGWSTCCFYRRTTRSGNKRVRFS